VAFRSLSGLVGNDTNGATDIFIRDRQTSQTSRVSIASNGTQGNDDSFNPSLSADGRYVAFESLANNLVSNDTNGATDIFIHDRQTSQTNRVSVASNGTQGNLFSFAPSLSADGRYVAFYSAANNLVNNDTNSTLDIFVHDRQTGQTSRVSVASNGTQGNDESYNPSLSADGRYVAFSSFANNLVSNDTNSTLDIFVHDRQTGQTSRVSVASNGAQANGASDFPSLSANGRYIAFASQASTLVSGDANGAQDVFVHALPVHLYLPLILKPAPQTYLFVTSINTGGINPVEIRDPDNGNVLLLSCVIGNNVTQFCGSFPPVGAYTIIAHTRNCGIVQGTFNDATPEASITRRVACN
jgi:Tol biopolymer transport system component